MAKYQQYEEYKDSGVEWLGEIPRDWKITRIKHSATLNMGQSPNSEDCNMDGNGYPFLQGNAEFGTMSPTAKQYCPIPRKLANEGDLLFSVRAPVGALNVADKVYGIGRGLCSLTSNSQMTQSFLWWVLPSYKYQLDAISTGSTFEAVSAEQVSNLLFALPTYGEQAQIANFLNHETAQIDTLIDKQQTLIQLLKEKRQAVISHAVTKGLNPDAPMKDSDVEWLGEVPEHWVVTKLGFHTSKIGSGKTPRGGAEVYQEEGVLFLRSQNIYNDGLRIDKSESVFISEIIHEEMSNTKVQGGDVLLNVTGGSIGRTCIVPDDFIEANVNQHVCIVRLPTSMSFVIAFVLKSSLVKEQIDAIQTGGNREGLNFEQIAKFIICLPPEKERGSIVNYIECETKKIDNLLEQSSHAIQLMQERRTALISAAVTGKIDVRDWQAAEVN